MRELLRRLGYLLRGSRFHEELDEEIQFHIETRADEIEQTGVARAEALRQARREFGHDLRAKEETRAAWRIGWLEDLVSDLRYAARAFRASPGFTAVAVLSLALGIGANTAIFSLVDTVMLKSLPVRHPEELRSLRWTGRWKPEMLWGNNTHLPRGETSSTSFSHSVFRELDERNRSFTELFGFQTTDLSGILKGHAFPLSAELVSGKYFEGLGVHAALGRILIGMDDTKPGANPVVVLSHRFWSEHFDALTSAIGSSITLNGTLYTVVGVMGQNFHGVETTGGPDLWMPISMQEQATPGYKFLNDPKAWWIRVIGRLRTGVSDQQARADLEVILRQTVTEQGLLRSQNGPRIEMTAAGKGLGYLRESYGKPLIILTIVVGLVLLIACANLANLLLARATARCREIGVRLAIGASRGRLIRQLLTESMLLSAIGATLGILFARWNLTVLPVMVLGHENISLEFGLDVRVLSFTAILSVLTAMAFGLAPALRASKVDMNPLLKTDSPKRSHRGRSLIVVQVAVALFLLIGAGLFVRTLVNLKSLDIGFRADGLLLFQLDPSLSGYTEAHQRDFFDELQRRIEANPGVRFATLSAQPLLSGRASSTNFSIQGHTAPSANFTETTFNSVAPRYFETMGIPILLGRGITDEDRAATPQVAVINEVIAREYFAGKNPIGARMGFGGPKRAGEMEIVGVAKDVKYYDLRVPAPPTVYVPFRQHGIQTTTVAVRTLVEPKSIISAVRQTVESLDRTMPISDVRTQEEQIDQSLRKERLFAKLCGFFSLTALLLTAIGVYGALSYAVARRTKEIGIRMAIGAERRNVIWLVTRESIWLTLAGVAIGVGAALATSNLLTKMLYGLKPNDPLTIGATALFLIAVAGLAAYLPGRKASRIDPLQALRHE